MTAMANSDPAPTAQAPWPLARTMLCAGLLVLAMETLFLFTGASGVRHGILIDPDCYMHLERAYRLMTGGWQAQGFDPRVNAPFGYAIHWTILFDALLAAGAWPLVWLGLSFHPALYVWGALISPLLLVLALGVFAWGVRPWIQGPSFLWLTVLLFTQPQLSGAFLVGRADHHSLILGMMLAELAWLYAALDGRTGRERPAFLAAFAAGIGGAIALCTTVEGLLIILLVSVVMGLAWSLFRRNVLSLLAAYWAGCLAATLAWLLVTRGNVFFQPANDRVSIMHAAVLTIGLIGIGAAAVLARWMPRITALVLAGVAAALMVGVAYPDFFLGPWPHLDPAVKAWHREIGELQPLLPDNIFHLGQFLAAFAARVDRTSLHGGATSPWRPGRAAGDARRLVRLLHVRRPVSGTNALVGGSAGGDAVALDAHHPAHHEKPDRAQAAPRPHAAAQRLPDGRAVVADHAQRFCRDHSGPHAVGPCRVRLGCGGARAGASPRSAGAL